ncbi:hypothetical protein DPMN_098221 [Dreissena polymorpha]|uniref:Transmembrane protein n=1 Tax=Dreissena polymorpha TaxID=45954 RepID=A0A9D4LCL4_DREPO|nr:hypothetical protein DPMN_098221 [Dreissena polymorpha]
MSIESNSAVTNKTENIEPILDIVVKSKLRPLLYSSLLAGYFILNGDDEDEKDAVICLLLMVMRRRRMMMMVLVIMMMMILVMMIMTCPSVLIRHATTPTSSVRSGRSKGHESYSLNVEGGFYLKV